MEPQRFCISFNTNLQNIKVTCHLKDHINNEKNIKQNHYLN